jgi:hypothetical protein
MERKVETHTITAGPKIVKTVVFGGETHILTLHTATYCRQDFSQSLVQKVTNEKGREVTGVWSYLGYKNTAFLDRLQFICDSKPDFVTKDRFTFSTIVGTKFLVAIVEKPETKSA